MTKHTQECPYIREADCVIDTQTRETERRQERMKCLGHVHEPSELRNLSGVKEKPGGILLLQTLLVKE